MLSLWRRVRRRLKGRRLCLLEDWIRARDRAGDVPSLVVVFYQDAWEILRAMEITQLDRVPDERVQRRDDGLLAVELSGANLVTVLAPNPMAQVSGQLSLKEPEGTLFRGLQHRLMYALVNPLTGEPNTRIPAILMPEE